MNSILKCAFGFHQFEEYGLAQFLHNEYTDERTLSQIYKCTECGIIEDFWDDPIYVIPKKENELEVGKYFWVVAFVSNIRGKPSLYWDEDSRAYTYECPDAWKDKYGEFKR